MIADAAVKVPPLSRPLQAGRLAWVRASQALPFPAAQLCCSCCSPPDEGAVPGPRSRPGDVPPALARSSASSSREQT